jgi:VWFA-related protein
MPRLCRTTSPKNIFGKLSSTLVALLIITIAFALLGAHTAHAQSPDTSRLGSREVIRADTQLVVVNVVVQDANGLPVHGLQASNFQLTEDHRPQTIRNFEVHTSEKPSATRPQLTELPPGTYSDYTAIPATGPLNILLIDFLNTPVSDQNYLFSQLRKYVRQVKPGTRIAIFALSSRLTQLQGFTSDPSILRNAIDRKLLPKESTFLQDSSVPGGNPSDITELAYNADISKALARLAAEIKIEQTELRTKYTFDAFNSLAHYLANFPGRKNLIWFSGAFPLQTLPDHDLQNPFDAVRNHDKEFRETTDLLSKAHVSIYPIDARGLMTDPSLSIANEDFDVTSSKFFYSQAGEHDTMSTLASQTGGQAFYNTNGLAAAVEKAISIGSDYYAFTYSPTNRDRNGKYRQIHISLTGEGVPPGVHLSYRHAYFADKAPHAPANTSLRIPEATPDPAIGHYARLAMSYGAPTPQDLLFKVSILPASSTTETAVVPGNSLGSGISASGPFRRYDVDYVALPRKSSSPSNPTVTTQARSPSSSMSMTPTATCSTALAKTSTSP